MVVGGEETRAVPLLHHCQRDPRVVARVQAIGGGLDRRELKHEHLEEFSLADAVAVHDDAGWQRVVAPA